MSEITLSPSGIRRGNYTQSRKNYGLNRFNRSFWARMKQMEENTSSVPDEILKTLDRFKAKVDTIKYYLPIQYGGLQQSWTTEKYDTPSGASVKMYFDPSLHKRLEPDNETEDKFTNPQLADWLTRKAGSKSEMYAFSVAQQELIDEYKFWLKQCWKEVLRY